MWQVMYEYMWIKCSNWAGATSSFGIPQGDLIPDATNWASKTRQGKGRDQIGDKVHGRSPRFILNMG